MKARIHFTVESDDGPVEDFIVISGETEDEIRKKAEAELIKRGGVDPWSEIL